MTDKELDQEEQRAYQELALAAAKLKAVKEKKAARKPRRKSKQTAGEVTHA